MKRFACSGLFLGLLAACASPDETAEIEQAVEGDEIGNTDGFAGTEGGAGTNGGAGTSGGAGSGGAGASGGAGSGGAPDAGVGSGGATAGNGGSGGGGSGGGGSGGGAGSGVDIDVDRNRNDVVDNEADDPNEEVSYKFTDTQGALVLVNCDSDRGERKRDFEDSKFAGADDLADLSPVALELKEDLKAGEELWIVLKSASDDGKIWLNVIDTEGGEEQVLVGPAPHQSELRIDNLSAEGAPVVFPDGKKLRYDTRFKLEGLNFNKETTITLEIRGGSGASDVVRTRNTPWLANNNTQPLAAQGAWQIPGNLTNSTSFQFKADHGATRTTAGHEGEFVQDSVEWGFQVRRRSDAPAQARTMITALRLHTAIEDSHPLKAFLNAKVGVYGYAVEGNSGVPFDPKVDETVFEKVDGDQGGNLECLPPSDKFPFGRIVHGDTMSDTLKRFLARQDVQVPAVVVNISTIGLAHVDEALFIAPQGAGAIVGMPDWKLAKKLLRANKKTEHNVMLVPVENNDLSTYGHILRWLENDKTGKAYDAKYDAALDSFQKLLKKEGATVVPLPGMFLAADAGQAVDTQRGFPRNVSNSQPTVAKTLVVSEPPLEGKEKKSKKQDPSAFLTEWTNILEKLGIKVAPENMSNAWGKGGEAHCSSNTLREPIRK